MSSDATNSQAEGISAASALRTVPRLTDAQWHATGSIARWMIISRASVLVMTFSAVALGGLLAVNSGRFDAVVWILCLAGSLLAHAANNQLNDLVDSRRGIDAGNYFRRQYGTHVLEDGLLDSNAFMRYVFVTGGCALLAGFAIAWLAGSVVLVPMAIGGSFLVFYTYPLKQLGLGEFAVLCVWGPLLAGGTYLATTGSWSWDVALIATVYGLGPAAVVFGKHVDKIDFDREKGIRTLPLRLGSNASRYAIVAMTALQYLGVLALIAARLLPWTMLIVFVAIPAALRLMRVCSRTPPAVCPDGYPESAWPLWYSAMAFVHTRNYGLLFLLGLLLAALGAEMDEFVA